jgi:hypothetical protein
LGTRRCIKNYLKTFQGVCIIPFCFYGFNIHNS